MTISNEGVKSTLTNISNKDNKISRDIRNGKLFKIKKGVYETDGNVPGYLLAGVIYGPSYLSFEYALSYYGLIPERVVCYTNATYDKKKKKEYTNHFGTFLYRDVPKNVYPMGICLIVEGNYSYQIATKEKAICDKLYTLSPLHNIKELEYMLFNDLRINKEEFNKLNYNDILELSKLYHSTNINLLVKYMRRNSNE